MLDKSVCEFSGALDFDLANCRMFVAQSYKSNNVRVHASFSQSAWGRKA